MITHQDVSYPGSTWPVDELLEPQELEHDLAINEYLANKDWQKGRPVLILGSKLAGKTTMGVYLLEQIPLRPFVYWKESDFLDDVKAVWRYERMTESNPHDDGLWLEYQRFTETFKTLRELPLLFFDNMGIGYTSMNLYEIDVLLHNRSDQKQLTIAAAERTAWAQLPQDIRWGFEKHGLVLDLP